MSKTKTLLWLTAVMFTAGIFSYGALAAPTSDTIDIDVNGASHSFPHFWEHMFGSGRANLTLRQSWHDDLLKTKTVTDVRYIRFHAIFHDELGVYDENSHGEPQYNFTYIDQIYDGLLKDGVKPFVELSFMPKKLASSPATNGFWYKPIVAPPKDWQKWEGLIYAFTKHLVERYGVDEVATWYFEVWNEPNIDFWVGEPKQSTYFKLYDTTAKAIKRVSPRLIVGGPSTAQAAWVDQFIKHCVDGNVPVDFVSTHVYGNDTAKNVLGLDQVIPRSDMVASAVKKVHDQVAASVRPKLPIIFSEYNASYFNEVAVTDSPFMGPWLANNIRLCDGLVNEMSYWTFSDVFEEQGVAKKPFYGGFGLNATGNIPKAAFNALGLLHKLGDTRLSVDSTSTLATRRADGTLAIALWNYFAPEDAGSPRTYSINIKGLPSGAAASMQLVDSAHGSSLTTWRSMGSPELPSIKQQEELRAAAQMPAPQPLAFERDKPGSLSITLPAHALALIEIK